MIRETSPLIDETTLLIKKWVCFFLKIERYENDFIRKYSLILSRFPNLCVLSIETDMKNEL